MTWSMTASACVTLAMVHLIIWLKGRHDRAQLLFSIAALAVAGVGFGELLILRARTPEEFGLAMRWTHLPLCVVIVAVVWFVRIYFGAGRLWLAWTVTVVRVVILIVNFCVIPNVNYKEITSVEQIPIWGGEQVAVAQGVIRPWTRLAQLGSLLFLVYVIDASVQSWRRGDEINRRRAVSVGGSLAFFVLAAAVHTTLVQQHIIHSPYLISVAFLLPLAAMAYQLGSDVVRSSQLSRELVASQSELHDVGERAELAAAAAGLGFWEWDIGRDIIWATDRCREMLGIAASKPIDLAGFLQTVHPDDRELIQAEVARSLSRGGDYDKQYRVVLPDGRTRWLAVRGRVDCNGSKAHARHRVRPYRAHTGRGILPPGRRSSAECDDYGQLAGHDHAG